ncbi:MAG TPA: hypothetical protein VEB20_04120 [Azospirillaceae bacterium]|nr:hypothetical protein [Azospirillaceae bacterium]
MPDIWTKHPEIVRDLLKEAGFTCGVQGRFLEGRDPAWTCIHDGKTMRGDLYIHNVAELRADLRTDPVPAPGGRFGDAGDWSAPALALLVGMVVAWRGRKS